MDLSLYCHVYTLRLIHVVYLINLAEVYQEYLASFRIHLKTALNEYCTNFETDDIYTYDQVII